MAAKRIDYRTAMRSAIDARHQPGDVKAAGKPGSARHVSGAGIEHPQNKLVPGAAGKGTDAASSGAKGGPSPHPQNLVNAEEAGESAAFEASEQISGAESGESVAGPSATAKPETPIPHAGSATSKPGSKGGAQAGHPQNKLVPVKVKRTAASPVRPTSKRRSGGFLHTLSKT